MMPYYGVPVGTGYETVGFGFNRDVIGEILRERPGFDGVVCTDWGIVSVASSVGDADYAVVRLPAPYVATLSTLLPVLERLPTVVAANLERVPERYSHIERKPPWCSILTTPMVGQP